MAIIPQIRCSRFAEAFEFYTKILDFESSMEMTRRRQKMPRSVFSPEKATKYSFAVLMGELAL